MKLLALLLVLTGILSFLASGYLYYQRINPQRLSFETSAISSLSQKKVVSKVLPIRITLPKNEIDTPIYQAEIHGTKWDMTDKGASYLVSSPLPGQLGNSIIYGHDFANIFGKLTTVKPGDKIVVFFNDGSKQNFQVKTTQTVEPTQGEILKKTAEARLTLYTCTGFLDSKRFVVVSEPQST